MWRFLAGMASALLLSAAGILYWQSDGNRVSALPSVPEQSQGPAATLADLPDPPSAVPKSKEEKRFNRYDKDKNGSVSNGEYLFTRQKGFARLDTNGDGTLQFSEYAAKTSQKFAKADADKSGTLNRNEFSSTRVVRTQRRRPACPPQLQLPIRPQANQEDDSEA